MCGITAILSPRKPVGVEALNAGIASLHHRGPDGRGSRISSDGTVALGHARLSIIDLETGDQPIVNEDESIWIVANGEFYDFEDIRTDLESRGHRFSTRSEVKSLCICTRISAPSASTAFVASSPLLSGMGATSGFSPRATALG